MSCQIGAVGENERHPVACELRTIGDSMLPPERQKLTCFLKLAHFIFVFRKARALQSNRPARAAQADGYNEKCCRDGESDPEARHTEKFDRNERGQRVHRAVARSHGGRSLGTSQAM